MGIRTEHVTITTEPTLLVLADNVAEMVYLHSSNGQCFIGNSGVTTSNGYRMDNGDKLTLQNHEGALYGVTAAATVQMQVMVIER